MARSPLFTRHSHSLLIADVIDSHCHLSDTAFAGDLPAVVARARAAGLSGALLVLPMGDPAELARAADVVALWPAVRLAIGVHPHQAGEYASPPDEVAAAVEAAWRSLPLARAVGEIGLDYHYDLSPRDVQRRVFRAQVRLARSLAVPVVIHTREAEEDTRRILEEECGGGAEGVLHCFTGSRAFADWAVGFGLHVSFAGIVTFPRAEALRAVARAVPPDRLLVETDSPYLAPVPHRGRRNEPAWVVRVAEVLADVRGTDVAGIDRDVSAAYAGLFRP
jgi:TatD DNase family protein